MALEQLLLSKRQARQKTRKLRGLVSYCCQLRSREKLCLNIYWAWTKGKKAKVSLLTGRGGP
jgi:hypothetical protein